MKPIHSNQICFHAEGVCLGTCQQKSLNGNITDDNADSFHQQPGTSSMKQALSTSEVVPSSTAIDYLNSFNFSLGDLDFGSEMAGLEYGYLGDMVQTPSSSTLLSSWHHQSAAPFVSGSMINTTISTTTPLHLSQQPISPFQSPLPTTVTSSSSQQQQQPRILDQQTNSSHTTPTDVSKEKPFNYADGFHYLIQYVREKMNRDDLMRISRALAKFRPSFLVLIMNLTEEDLIFMEKCIQRTLLEYEKLISFSGTPTVVWRRTGEICLFGKEFCLLTQWTKELLLDKKTYIYELMDCPSAVEYWEHFSRHAFDNTDSSRHYTCILQSPKKRPIPCTFCFMIKRDIFDLPSVIVGNFLPILS
ncbi:hypothetical protein BC941DRAFT_422573 [Chlamydoabsidia padenii]|nr:hypothetical protein BC941DRAFT_422573 [Chlamydoabsidia padenii]